MSIDYNNFMAMSDLATNLLSKETLSPQEIRMMRELLETSNRLYNNSDMEILPLEDGVYDLLLEKYKNYGDVPIGASPQFISQTAEVNDNKPKQVLNVFIELPKDYKDKLFMSDIIDKRYYDGRKPKTIFRELSNFTKKVVETPHLYPKLVGTLDKCKFVMNYQAQEKGVISDSNVKIVERDFFGKHIKDGILDPNRRFRMICKLKYDGVSVEAKCSNKVITACSRGDTSSGIATDLTPLLKDYPFLNSVIPDDEAIGIKFEAIMTYNDLYKFNMMSGYDYKNCRTAISGLFSNSNGLYYKDLITLVPLATSIEDIDEVTETEFLNKYFTSGVGLYYSIIEGNYQEILFQIKRYVEEMEMLRDTLGFMYDGVVISYLDEDIRERLGRSNSINKYSIAVKFEPLKKSTIFSHCTYSVGQDGTITPKAYFKPINFFGTTHNNTTLHSYKRFMELGLRVGDIVDVEYVNDVICYLTKPDNSHNANNQNPILQFIQECPECGSKLVVSTTGNTVKCNNPDCRGKKIARVVNMMNKLNLKDFSDERIMALGKYHLFELAQLTREELEPILGNVMALKFIDRMNELKIRGIYDYEFFGALGFSSIAKETWKLIFENYTIDEFMRMNPTEMKTNLLAIKGIGTATIITIIDELEYFIPDILYILNNCKVIQFKGVVMGPKVCVTGFRDKDKMDLIRNYGFNVTDGSLTKDTLYLLVPSLSHTSTKVSKAIKLGIKIIQVDDFIDSLIKSKNI